MPWKWQFERHDIIQAASIVDSCQSLGYGMDTQTINVGREVRQKAIGGTQRCRIHTFSETFKANLQTYHHLRSSGNAAEILPEDLSLSKLHLNRATHAKQTVKKLIRASHGNTPIVKVGKMGNVGDKKRWKFTKNGIF